MSQARRVLVLTLSFGSGHVRAAAAVARALARQAPDADIRVVDALDGCGLPFRVGYVWPYWAMVRYAPALWGRLFAARLRRRSEQTAPAWAFRLGCREVFKTVARFNPDIIIATEVAACEMAVIARRSHLTRASIVNVITDRHAEPAWVKAEVDVYAVADPAVAKQLCAWGTPPDRVFACGMPIDSSFQARIDPRTTRSRYGLTDHQPIVLLMGGGMGPTRMDRVAARLAASDLPMHIVAVAGHDVVARRRLSRLQTNIRVSVTVLGWTDDVPALMQAAAVLVTKPGGLTTTEAAACRLPAIMLDAIPGPEQHNASYVVEAGAGILAQGPDDAAEAVLSLLRNESRRRAMSVHAGTMARPAAARAIATLALAERAGSVAAPGRPPYAGAGARVQGDPDPATERPVLILTIRNGAGHIRTAEAIAAAVRGTDWATPVAVVDVADFMTPGARMTHVTAYLWLVKHAPALWDRIDRFQKRQPHTSPEWYYRRGCQRLFDLARRLRPRALIAAEVGCCEIGALLKRDLALECPLIAVNGEYDADRAWVQPEVDLYCAATERVLEELSGHGAPRERVRVWGVPLALEFTAPWRRDVDRESECRRLGLAPELPLILIAGGSEGLGRVEAVTARLLRLDRLEPQLVVLAGRSEALRSRCERLTRGPFGDRLRVLGWTTRMPALMRAADLMVSKLGHTFDEAIASGLPLVALEPPPGSERVQYRLLDDWGVGRAVRTLDDMAAVVERLLDDRREIEAMREAASARRTTDAAQRIALWVMERTVASTMARPAHADEATTCVC